MFILADESFRDVVREVANKHIELARIDTEKLEAVIDKNTLSKQNIFDILKLTSPENIFDTGPTFKEMFDAVDNYISKSDYKGYKFTYGVYEPPEEKKIRSLEFPSFYILYEDSFLTDYEAAEESKVFIEELKGLVKKLYLGNKYLQCVLSDKEVEIIDKLEREGNVSWDLLVSNYNNPIIK